MALSFGKEMHSSQSRELEWSVEPLLQDQNQRLRSNREAESEGKKQPLEQGQKIWKIILSFTLEVCNTNIINGLKSWLSG